MKREFVYKEVLGMLNDGADYQAVTLSEVARRCGVGKSTLYDYFNSKDEMIYNSFLYYVNRMIKFFSQGFKITTFDQSLRVYLKSLCVCMSANFWMVFPWTFESYLKYLGEADANTLKKLLEKSQKMMISLLENICEVGFEEEKIVEYDDYKIRFIFFGAVGEISCTMQDDFDLNSEEGKDFLEDLIFTVTEQLSY